MQGEVSTDLLSEVSGKLIVLFWLLWYPHNNLALRDKVTQKEILLQQLATQLSEGVCEYHMISINIGCYL